VSDIFSLGMVSLPLLGTMLDERCSNPIRTCQR
jgi:hypothetical protein